MAQCIQPAAADDGLALGAALYVSNSVLGEGKRWQMENAYLGDEFSDDHLRSELERYGLSFEELSREELIDRTTDVIKDGNVVGWFQGRMEWGPRALGNRSILGDPRRSDMKELLNLKIKRRESFRPFAPSIQREAVAELASVRGIALRGPWIPLLRSPEVMRRARAMGDYLRYESTLPPRLSEFVILMTARAWTQNYEWHAHHKLALQAGLDAAVAQAAQLQAHIAEHAEQRLLDVAQEAFDGGNHSLAAKAARRVVRVWPFSDYAPEAQYLLGHN